MTNQNGDDEIAAEPETTPERNGAEIRDAWAKIAADPETTPKRNGAEIRDAWAKIAADDEIEQPVTKAANPETALCVNFNIVGDLLTDELDSWHLGICEVVKDDDDLLVCGENGQVVERVDTDVWTTSTLFDGIEAKDLAEIADTINSAIAAEYDDL